MQHNLKEFISEALCQPSDYVSYFASAKLTEMFTGAAILENEAWAFNVPEFAAAGLCTLWQHEEVHCQAKTKWEGVEDPLERELENGWLSVLWPQGDKEHFVDIVYLTWNDAGCETTRRWIIAESAAVAEAFFRAVCAYGDEAHGEVLVYEDGGWEKDDKLFASIRGATFDNLILPPALKEELRADFTRFLAARAVYQQYGIPWKRGALLTGPPGNGKTHTIKALANELKLPCLYVKSFKASHGTEQGHMGKVFTRARRCAPCLVVLEDLDALIEDENRAFLLNELDGFAANEGVLVIATTNHPEKLDPALLERPSRFDRKYEFSLPALAERLAYAEHWNRTLQAELRLTESELAAIAAATAGFSFAYLKELFVSALMQWMSAQVTAQSSIPAVGQAGVKLGAVLLDNAAQLRQQFGGTVAPAPKVREAAAGRARQ